MLSLNKRKNTEYEQLQQNSVTDDYKIENAKKSKDRQKKQKIKTRRKVTIRNFNFNFHLY